MSGSMTSVAPESVHASSWCLTIVETDPSDFLIDDSTKLAIWLVGETGFCGVVRRAFRRETRRAHFLACLFDTSRPPKGSTEAVG